MVSNPSELRARLTALFETEPLTVGGQTFGPEVTDEAIEELIGALVRGYLNEGGSTACEKIVGALFIGLLDASVTTLAHHQPES
jgi:hypothetical protein